MNFSQSLFTGNGSDYKWYGTGTVNLININDGNAGITQQDLKDEKYIKATGKDGYKGITTGNPICDLIYGAYDQYYN